MFMNVTSISKGAERVRIRAGAAQQILDASQLQLSCVRTSGRVVSASATRRAVIIKIYQAR